MHHIRSVVPRGVELLGKGVEWFRINHKVVDVKYGFCIRKVVLLDIVIETSARCSEEKKVIFKYLLGICDLQDQSCQIGWLKLKLN